ncbi:hypothetical protein [Vibrio amylolyticus]|uniref:hypothetical protein n=1 Tax=Vibrio amylolyticus TaxID=2847292 RepID=UPI0035526831
MRIEGFDSSTQHGSQWNRKLTQFLVKNKDSFEGDLIPDLDFINHRAENHTGIDIGAVEHQTINEYVLSYSVDWDIYNGCADMEENGTIQVTIPFTVEHDGEIKFDYSIVESRSTVEEF